MIGEFNRRTPGCADGHDDYAAVFGRGQFLGQTGKNHHRHNQPDDTEPEQQPGLVQGKPQHSLIAVGEAVQDALTEGPKPMPLGTVGTVPEPLGAEHRRQGQSNQAGNHHGGGQGEAEFRKQPAHVPAHERDGHKHRHQCQRGGDHRESHLLGAPVGRQQRWFAFINATLDVLQHDNGIVHHQADGQNDGQQGKHVDGKAQETQADKRTDHRHRNGDRRNQGRAPGAQEQKDNQYHQRYRNRQRGQNLFDRSPDKHRFVIALGNTHFRRQGLANLHQLRLHRIRHRYRVGLGLADYPHPDSGFAIGPQTTNIRFHPDLNIGNLAQAQQVVAIPADHQIAEIFHIGQPPFRAHGKVAGGGVH